MPLCRLCEREVPELRDSHIASKWVYKRIREGTLSNPNPVRVQGGRSVQTSSQVREYLLCDDCEHLFNIGGEDYAASVAYQPNGDCSLYKLTAYESPVRRLPHPRGPEVRSAERVDISKLVHFAIGVFWRASVSSKVPRYRLLPSWEALLRGYLLGTDRFPDGVALLLQIYDQPRSPSFARYDRIVTIPHWAPGSRLEVHEFLCCGLYFGLMVGPGVATQHLAASLPQSGHVVFAAANRHPYTGRVRDAVGEAADG